MKAELAPPRGAAVPPGITVSTLGWVAALSLLAALAFWAPLIFGGALHHFDWGSHHYHYFDWLRESLTQHRTLPLYMADAWVTPNFLANAESPSFGPLVGLLLVLPTDAYIKLLIVVYTAAGLGGMFLLLRDLDLGVPVAVLASLVFAFNGFFVSHLAVGHHWAMGGYLLPVLLCLYRRGALGSTGALAIAAIVDASTILAGQHQPFIWQNLVLGGFALCWAIRVQSVFPLTRAAILMLAAAGLAAFKLLPMLSEFAGYDPAARIPGVPLSLIGATLAAPGQDPAVVHPVLGYEHGSGWWEYAFYVGPVALACMIAGLAAARRVWPLSLVGALFLVFSIDWPASLGWLQWWSSFEHLPLLSSQRCPSRFLILTLFAFSVTSAIGLDRLWRVGQARNRVAARLLAVVLLGWIALDLHLESRVWQRAAIGAPLASRPHEPRPLRLQPEPGVWIELREFAPNRLVYHARSSHAVRVTFPPRQPRGGGGWRIEAAGESPAFDGGEEVVVELAAGERDIVMIYRPPYLLAGAAVSIGSAIAVVVLVCRRRKPVPA